MIHLTVLKKQLLCLLPTPLHYNKDCIKNNRNIYVILDESSDAEGELRPQDRSSCDTLDQSSVQDCSGRKYSKQVRKTVRQARLKR